MTHKRALFFAVLRLKVQMEALMAKIARPKDNPLAIFQDTRVVSAALGLLAAQLLRKWLYTSQRNVFGWAAKTDKGIVYYEVNPDGSVNKNKEVPNAKQNRLLAAGGYIVAGTILLVSGEEKGGDPLTAANDDDGTLAVKFAGLSFAASGFANGIGLMFDLDL